MSELILHERKILDRKHMVEIKIWKVKKQAHTPEGMKYSLVLIRNGERILGYDNNERRGHHRHVFGKRTNYKFSDVDKLVKDFHRDVNKVRKGELK